MAKKPIEPAQRDTLSGLAWWNDLESARREVAQLHGMLARIHATLRLQGIQFKERLDALNDYCAKRANQGSGGPAVDHAQDLEGEQ